jgi:hypothetical protein
MPSKQTGPNFLNLKFHDAASLTGHHYCSRYLAAHSPTFVAFQKTILHLREHLKGRVAREKLPVLDERWGVSRSLC